VAVALSGIAGPDGGTPDKPVGTVWIGWAVRDVVDAERFLFSGSRDQVKLASADRALAGLEERLAAVGVPA
jgi:nicotinamide-nucleotide amidase